MKRKKSEVKNEKRGLPNQAKAPGEIQSFSKHLKKNSGQGRGQRVKAHQ